MTNDAFTGEQEVDGTDEDDSDLQHYEEFLKKPTEGGQNKEKFNYKQFISESDDTSSESTDNKSDTSEDSTDSDDSSEESTDNKVASNAFNSTLRVQFN